MKYLLFKCFLLSLPLLGFRCKTESPKQEKATQTAQKKVDKTELVGNYVSDSYSKRNKGYDWIAVTVRNEKDNQLKITIRSRADLKKPTCTFEAVIQKLDDTTYTTQIEDKNILFHFRQNTIFIEGAKEEDKNVLYFYCSGGATLEGNYAKINEPLDQNQIDKTTFSKILKLQNVGFNISSIEKNSKNQLRVFTFGLPNEFNETIVIENQLVTGAEVDDLNADGSPELVVFTAENNINKKGNVYAFSVNNKKSMSAVYFQRPLEKTINTGYNGHDEFTLMEGKLVHRFPIFENNVKTNKVRQIEYKLIEGETSRKFIVHKQTEY